MSANAEQSMSIAAMEQRLKEMEEQLKLQASELLQKTSELKALEEKMAQPPTCEICAFPYSAEGDHVPRLLECGHTVCHKCTESLVTKDPMFCQTLIKCPFDRQRFLLNKDLAKLPKNYFIIQMLSRS
ncbi:unnamed protein product [Caenorhabditis sp. 36 PRJEB53466]|nr:unnamed protein product [Caenorhabditis sp. 36 PRJEB53466]